MSKKKINIKENVMGQIHEKKINMRPRIYFILGSALVVIGLILSAVTTVFLVSLTSFAFKTHGPMGQYRFEQLLASFPWWAPVIAFVGLSIGILLLKKYEISYRHNFAVIIVGLIMTVLVAVLIIDYLNFDDAWFRRGPMRGVMRQYIQNQEQYPRFMDQNGPGPKWMRK